MEQATHTTPAEIVIVGSGAAGTEIAFCLDAALAQRYARSRYRVTVLDAGAQVLAGYPARFRDKALKLLHQRGIAVRTNVNVAAVEPSRIVVQDGAALTYHALLWATSPRAPALFRDGDLPVDRAGYLRVEPVLQVGGPIGPICHPSLRRVPYASGDQVVPSVSLPPRQAPSQRVMSPRTLLACFARGKRRVQRVRPCAVSRAGGAVHDLAENPRS